MQDRTIGFGEAPWRSPRILAADDNDDIRAALQRALVSFGYEVETARDGHEAVAKVKLEIDLVLLDAEMPGLDGFDVARRIRADPEVHDLPIMMVTGLDSRADRLRAVEAGVNDFIAKPFELTELKLRSASLLRMKRATDAIKRYSSELEQVVQRRTAELRRALEDTAAAQRDTHLAHLDTIRRLVVAAEYKDRDTASHIERIGLFSEVIARQLGLSPSEVELIRHAAPMHDVGKLGVPDAVLTKPGKLDDAEWVIMQQHTTIGARILAGSPSPVLQIGESIALCHHERWDGGGYPAGLAREEIPLAARICAVADVFDALTSNRHYRGAMTNVLVYELLRSESGKHFDPVVLDAFLGSRAEVEAIQEQSRV